MIKNIILILLTILSIVFGTLYYVDYVSEKTRQEDILNNYKKQIDDIKKETYEKIELFQKSLESETLLLNKIRLKASVSSVSKSLISKMSERSKESKKFLVLIMEQKNDVEKLEELYSNSHEEFRIRRHRFKVILNAYEDLKMMVLDNLDLIMDNIKEKKKILEYIDRDIDRDGRTHCFFELKPQLEIIRELIKKNKNEEINSTENNKTEKNLIINNQEEELDEKEPVKVVFDNSNIKSEDENNTLEELFDNLKNTLNVYTTLNEEITPRYNLLKFVRECKKNIKEREIRNMISSFIEQKHECINLENIYAKKLNKHLDNRVIKKQRRNVIECYKTLETLTFDLEDTSIKLVDIYENFSLDSNNLGKKDLLYFKSIIKKIDMLHDGIVMEKEWISLKVKDLEIK